MTVTTKNGRPAPLTPIGDALAHGRASFRGKNGEMRLMGGSIFSASIGPGKTFHDSLQISTYIDFSQPDEYLIRMQRADHSTNIIVDSNTVVLKVAR